VGTIQGTNSRDYRYGAAPQAMLTSRLVLPNRASLELTGRAYYADGIAVPDSARRDRIARAELSITLPVQGRNAITVRPIWSWRDAAVVPEGGHRPEHASVSVFFTRLLSTVPDAAGRR
jgi:hypothetical protein